MTAHFKINSYTILMKKFFKTVLLTAMSLLMGSTLAHSQDVQWKYRVNDLGNNTFEIVFDAAIEDTWHMYDLGPYDAMGPNPTMITFEGTEGARLEGEAYELTEPIVVYDEVFGMEIGYYEHAATIAQKVVLTAPSASLKGYVEWMVCNDVGCTPMQYWDFEIDLTSASGTAVAAETTAAGGGSLWGMILEAILWGFAALLTPCVFPMVPMTVSFFLKGSENKARGRFRAGMYGLFIILLYTLPIAALIIITRWLGGDAVTADIFNWLATHWLPNIIFFIVFMIFAASFFGAFDITMPSKLVNKTDTKSDKGGLGGIFFMALTLVLVSFSCTGPIVGNVLINSISGGNFWQPIITMFAFSVAFALPFTVLALFPSLLNKLPKSGGWLNSVKVVLGFIEVALGFKFLSVADQTYHWGLLDREVYLAIWIVTFALLGFYLLGKLRFAHDSEVKTLSVGRLALAIVDFAFVVYMIPGMWGAPLKALSGYLPPLQTQDFILGQSPLPVIGGADGPTLIRVGAAQVKYGDFLSMPHGITGYFEWNEALAAARAAGKPLFVDVTGHGCVNCREMEQKVLSDERVQQILRDDYIVVALYTDDKARAAGEDWVTTEGGTTLKEIGRINSYIARARFNVNAQPNYIVADAAGAALLPPRGYDLSVEGFVDFLERGVAAYKARTQP